MRDFGLREVTELLDVKAARIHQWIKEGFVSPSYPAGGYGTRNRWSFNDLISLGVFRDLISQGFSRAVAKQLIGPLNPIYSVDENGAVLLKQRRNWDGTPPDELISDGIPTPGEVDITETPPSVFVVLLRDSQKTTSAVLEVPFYWSPLGAAEKLSDHLGYNDKDRLFAMLFPVDEIIEQVATGINEMELRESLL